MDAHADTLALALCHHQAGRHAAAEASYRQVLQDNAADPTALYLYGCLQFEMGSTRSAIDLMRKVVALRPDRTEGHVALARLLSSRGEHRVAAASYRAAVALSPDQPATVAELAKALHAAGDFEGAIEACRSALDRHPHAAALHEALGSALLAAGKAVDACASLRTAVALQPNLATARFGLARALLCAGCVMEAVAAIDALQNVNSLPSAARAQAWFLRGAAHKALQEFLPAIAAFEHAIAADSQHAAAHLNLGNCFAATDRPADAQRHLQKALAIDPSLKEAHASLGSVLLLAGNESAAEQCCRRALAIDPEMVVAHQNLAAICQAMGRAAEARSHRDAAYRRQNIFIEAAGRPRFTVLMLTTADSGNVPTRSLFPRDRCTVVKWFIEYASPDQETCLPPYDLVFNGIGDPDAAGPTTAPVERFLRQCRGPIINAPARVARTRRDRLPFLLDGIANTVVPPVRRLSPASFPNEKLPPPVPGSAAPFPILLRSAGSHGGQSMVLVESAAAFAAIRCIGEAALYATRFWPYRSADGYHRKYRMIFVGRTPYPYHLAISHHWLVHYVTADMLSDPAKCEEERRFLDDPESIIGATAMDAIRTIGDRLDLDFAGIDFSILPDGRVLVFEANATMLVHPEDEAGPFAYKNPAVYHILNAFDTMVASRLRAPSCLAVSATS
jgi:tetratricopeptide (TPR) repeat protein